MNKSQIKIKTPVGALYLVASETGLQSMSWEKQAVPMNKNRVLTRAEKELSEYFLGKRKTFSLPLEPQGTPFQLSVWRALSKIPYGKTISYKELAKNIKNEKAVRAVGTANGKNPFCIIVPCHRVIAANGTLGGYSGRGGVKTKQKLLDLESGFF